MKKNIQNCIKLMIISGVILVILFIFSDATSCLGTGKVRTYFEVNFTQLLENATTTADIEVAVRDFTKSISFLEEKSIFAKTIKTSKTDNIVIWHENLISARDLLTETVNNEALSKNEKFDKLREIQKLFPDKKVASELLSTGTEWDAVRFKIPIELIEETPGKSNSKAINTLEIICIAVIVFAGLVALSIYYSKEYCKEYRNDDD